VHITVRGFSLLSAYQKATTKKVVAFFNFTANFALRRSAFSFGADYGALNPEPTFGVFLKVAPSATFYGVFSPTPSRKRKKPSYLLCIFSGENTNTTKDFSLVVLFL